ncbi:MAG: protoporphyrinogen oxidase [Deltaproteobacteria bacterium]|nr:protoporphyrinogen oxidase [Deltaproteobacteria bacterium]
MYRVAIIGGGISGLAVAAAIERRGAADGIDLRTLVIEKDQRLGGKLRSITEDGYLCEWGPNGFLDSKPGTLDLCRQVGVADRLLRSNDHARRRFIYAAGELHQLPEGALSFFASPLISWPGKLRLAVELLIPARCDGADETLADFARRRLGAEALEKLIGPMVSGVFAGDPETMSLQSAFPRIHQLEQEHGGLIRALFLLHKKRRAERQAGRAVSGPSGPGGKLTSFAHGVEEMIPAVASCLQGEIRCGAGAIAVKKQGEGFSVELEDGAVIETEAVVSACPAYAAGALTAALDKEMSLLLGGISYSPLWVVCFGYQRGKVPHDLNGFGFLAAKGARLSLLGTLWDSSIFPHRAPEGHILLRSMVGGATWPEVTSLAAEEVEQKVKMDLKAVMGISEEPDFVRSYPHPRAIPQYLTGHARRLAALAERAALHPGFFFTGNAFSGVGINDCVGAANATAARVVDFLSRREASQPA